MSDRHCCPDSSRIRDAICIDTERVYDSCADKDCLRDLRVYIPDQCQRYVDNACSVRCRGSEILNCLVEVERVPFNKGFYTVDLTFYIKVTLDLLGAPGCPATIVCGLVCFSKKCILYGSEGNVRTFTSKFREDAIDDVLPMGDTNPRAKVQCAEPICLSAELCRICDCCNTLGECDVCVPSGISRCFDGCITCAPSCERVVRVTIGIFTIIQLQRDVQMLIPAYDFCVPTKECSCVDEDPSDAFKKIGFPIDEFFPPNRDNISDNCAPKFGCQ